MNYEATRIRRYRRSRGERRIEAKLRRDVKRARRPQTSAGDAGWRTCLRRWNESSGCVPGDAWVVLTNPPYTQGLQTVVWRLTLRDRSRFPNSSRRRRDFADAAPRLQTPGTLVRKVPVDSILRKESQRRVDGGCPAVRRKYAVGISSAGFISVNAPRR